MSDFCITYGGNGLTVGGSWMRFQGTYDPENPCNLPDNTFRFQFDGAPYDPTTSGETWTGNWTQVSASPNIWDFICTAYNYEMLFKDKFATGSVQVRLLGAVMTNTRIRRMNSLFEGCTRLVSTAPMKIGGNETIRTAANLFSGCTNLASVGYFNFSNFSDGVSGQGATGMFGGCSSLTTIPLIDTSNVQSFGGFFSGCTSLTSCPLIDTSSATSMQQMFMNCTALTSIPVFDTANVTIMSSMLYNTSITHIPLMDTSRVNNFRDFCHGTLENATLVEVPLLDTSSATNVSGMFRYQLNVESGALDLYNQMSTQTYPPATHDTCFDWCGRDTTTGAAELAQIPTSWGGTMS